MKTIPAMMVVLSCCGLAACAPQTTGGGSGGGTVDREAEARLGQLFDQTGSADAGRAAEAAKSIASLNEADSAAVAAYWQRRGTDARQAKAIGDALVTRANAVRSGSEMQSCAGRAVDWLKRALKATDAATNYVFAADVRLSLARAYASGGDSAAALEIAANRVESRPLPAALEKAYADFIAGLATAMPAAK